MSLGGSVGGQYEFDPVSFGSNPIDGRTSQGVNSGAPSIGAPLGDLESKDRLVENYLNSWVNLESVAKHAKKNYGIDVTAPDLQDPVQKKLYKTFMKAYAQTQADGNALKNGRENEKLNAGYAAANPEFRNVRQDENEPTRLGGMDVGLTTDTDSVVKAISKTFNSSFSYNKAVEAKKNALADYENRRLELEDLLRNETDNNERSRLELELEGIERNITAVKTANPDFQPLRAASDNGKGASNSKMINATTNYYQKLVDHNKDALAIIEGADGVQSAIYGRKDGKKVIIVKSTKEGKEDIYISLDNASEGIEALGSFLANHHKEFAGLKLDDLDSDAIDMSARKNKVQEEEEHKESVNTMHNALRSDDGGLFDFKSGKGVDGLVSRLKTVISPSSPLMDAHGNKIIGIDETSLTGWFGKEVTLTYTTRDRDTKKFTNTFKLTDDDELDRLRETLKGIAEVNLDVDFTRVLTGKTSKAPKEEATEQKIVIPKVGDEESISKALEPFGENAAIIRESMVASKDGTEMRVKMSNGERKVTVKLNEIEKAISNGYKLD